MLVSRIQAFVRTISIVLTYRRMNTIVIFVLVFASAFANVCNLPKDGVWTAKKPDGCPNIVSRSEWSAAAAKKKTALSCPIKHVIIHHTANKKTCLTMEDCKAKIRQIQRYHMGTKGWDDIGYNYIIGGDGNIYEGRGIRVGAHAPNYNSNGFGISLIGDYSTKAPSQKMLDATAALIKCMKLTDALSTNYVLKGHRQVSSTACPGDSLYAKVKEMANHSP